MCTIIHLGVDIRGLLLKSDRELKGWITDDEGRTLSSREARLALMDELAKGRRVLPADPTCESTEARMEIDWKRVNERLRCPQCGDKAYIEPGTDGTVGMHTHRFKVSRLDAERLSLPTKVEAARRIAEIEAELAYLRPLVTEGGEDGSD